MQLPLFPHLLDVYARHADGIPNAAMYEHVARAAGVSDAELRVTESLGQTVKGNAIKRRLRWYQQTLKQAGALEHVPGSRGVWRMTDSARQQLTPAPARVSMVAFSTSLGCALLSACEDFFPRVDVPITLSLLSPPYPLRKPRPYGNPDATEYIDFLTTALEGVVRNLVPGGSLCLNLSSDVFEPGLPARSLYKERTLIALHERLGLHLVDTFIWHNPSKPPGPVQYASVRRFMLNSAYEPVYWLTNDPQRLRADNRRVLQEHTRRHLDLIAAGGEQRDGVFADGAHRIRRGRSFAAVTQGKIPRNVLTFGHACGVRRQTAAAARAAGLPVHGAGMPLRLARFLIDFLTEKGDVVVDPMAGWCTTALAAEQAGRQWLATEKFAQYALGAGLRFKACQGFEWGALGAA